MGWIDEKGRLFGRVSLVDALIVLALLGLGLGYIYKQTFGEVRQIVNANTVIYLTMRCEGLREDALEAVAEGDIMYKRYERQALGTVIKLERRPAMDILYRQDGTASLAALEGYWDLYMTLRCEGSSTNQGFFINGNQPVAEGVRFEVHSNSWIAMAYVYAAEAGE